jgi:hypothetical protein
MHLLLIELDFALQLLHRIPQLPDLLLLSGVVFVFELAFVEQMGKSFVFLHKLPLQFLHFLTGFFFQVGILVHFVLISVEEVIFLIV